MDTLTYIAIYIAIIMVVGIFLGILIKSRSRTTDINELSGSSESLSPLQLAARESASSQVMKKGLKYGLIVLISILSVSLGQFWKWWAKPLKIIITFLLILVATIYFGFKVITQKTGDIVIDVRDFSELFDGNRISNIPIFISAVDKNSYDQVEITDVEFISTDNKKPQKGHIRIFTNDDGLAFVKYSGYFDKEDFALKVKVLPTKHYENIFKIDSLPLDTIFASEYFKVFSLERKREMVEGSMQIDLSNKDLKGDLMNPPPETVDLKIYTEDFNGIAPKNATFFISSNKELKDTNKFELDGTYFVLKDHEIDKPFYIAYIVEDGSKVKIKFHVEESKAEGFNFEPEEVEFDVNKGGASPGPVKAEVVISDTCCGPKQFSIRFVNSIGKALPGRSVNIYSNDHILDEVYTTDKYGMLVFPENPIEDLCYFWKDKRFFWIIMNPDHPTNKTNRLSLRKPSCNDDGKRTYLFDDNKKEIIKQ